MTDTTEKTQRFIDLAKASEKRVAELVYALQRAIIRAEALSPQVVTTSHLRWILGDDEPPQGMTEDELNEAQETP